MDCEALPGHKGVRVKGRRANISTKSVEGINVFTGIGSVFHYDERAGTLTHKELTKHTRLIKKLQWVVLHARVSGVEQAQEGHYGLHTQATQVVDAATRAYGEMWDGDVSSLKTAGWAVLSVNAEVMSGRKHKAKRPLLRSVVQQYKAALKLGLKPLYGMARLDRCCRELETWVAIEKEDMEILVAHGPKVDGMDGKMFARFAITMGEWEAGLIQARTAPGRAAAAAARAAAGATVHRAMHDTNQDIHDHRAMYAEQFRDALTAYIERGMTLRAMAAELNAAGHRTFTTTYNTGLTTGAGKLHDNYIRNMLIMLGLKGAWDAMLEDRNARYQAELDARQAAAARERHLREQLREHAIEVERQTGHKRHAPAMFITGKVAKATVSRMAKLAERKAAAAQEPAAQGDTGDTVVSLLSPGAV